MRRFRTSLASVALSLSFGSISLFAQTEDQDQLPAVASVQIKDQAAPENQPDEIPAAASGETAPQVATEINSAEPASPDTVDSKTIAPQETVEPKKTVKPDTESQQSPRPAAVQAKQRRFALTFNDLKFDQDKGEAFDRELLTSKINSYHGGKVKIRGYIRPNFKQSGITKFIFVRDNKECCFGAQAAIFDNILVRLDEGESTNYTVRPITVEGDFVLKEYRGENGKVWSLYRMYNAEVK